LGIINIILFQRENYLLKVQKSLKIGMFLAMFMKFNCPWDLVLDSHEEPWFKSILVG
jgi:hypothetical protein